MIINVGLYQSIFNTHSPAVTTQHTETNTVDGDHSVGNNEISNSANTNLYLSSKSQKINALSREFFSNKELNFADIEKLKERAYQFGLISKNEYLTLSKSEAPLDNDIKKNLSTDTTSLLTLNEFIDGFIERLNDINVEHKEHEIEKEQTDSEKSINDKVEDTLIKLTTSLQMAKGILTNIDKINTKEEFSSNLTQSLSFIKETINSESFNDMPLDDKVGLSKIYQTLEIVNNMTPQRLTNEKINKYIELIY